MTLAALTAPFPWLFYSKKLQARIDHPRNVGFFSEEESASRGVHLARGSDGQIVDGNCVVLYWLVDPHDGTIVDARFQLFGQSALIGAADVACELLIGKNYDQASRMTADLIDKQVRDRSEDPAFPKETFPHLNLVVGAILDAVDQCRDLPLADGYHAPPVPLGFEADLGDGGYPGWDDLPHDKKVQAVEQVLDREVRPYIALDAGGVDLVELTTNREVIIAYKGSCTSCYSSVGTTLAYIQQTLRAKIHPQIVVIPN